MSAFKIIEGATAVIRQAGRYREVGLAHRAGQIYAMTSKSSYIRLIGCSRTTAPGWVWDEINDPTLRVVLHPTRAPTWGGE